MTDSGVQFYFAYGSNMYEPRMRARVPSAHYYDAGRLPGYCLAFRKHGRDGSAKCDLDPYEPGTVWGVLYCIDAAERRLLDEAEGEGYVAMDVTIAAHESFVDAFTYKARPDWVLDALPYQWYLDLIVEGARRHDLPAYYVEALAAMDAEADPDPDRAAANRPR